MTMKFCGMDLTQPSTWRGAAGIIALFGISVSPELTNQIAIALGAALSAIELFRNEYAIHNPPLPPIELQSHAAAVVQSDRVRQSMPTEPETTRNSESSGFGDR
jgi:hypothetical protein